MSVNADPKVAPASAGVAEALTKAVDESRGLLPIDKILVGKRVRKDLGDLTKDKESLQRVGLLHPIVVKKVGQNYHLVAGRRRLEAARQLGWEKVQCSVRTDLKDATKALIAERDENTCRKDLTPSEMVAFGRRLEALERPAAKERQRGHGGTAPGREANTSGNFPEVSKGQTRDKVAEALGVSGRTYKKMEAVVEAAEEDPGRFGDLQEQMDRTGKVDAAYREAAARGRATGKDGRKQPARKPEPDPDDEGNLPGTIDGYIGDIRGIHAVLTKDVNADAWEVFGRTKKAYLVGDLLDAAENLTGLLRSILPQLKPRKRLRSATASQDNDPPEPTAVELTLAAYDRLTPVEKGEFKRHLDGDRK
jgi:hypothetical protein